MMDNVLKKVDEVNPVDPSFVNRLRDINQRQYEQQTARQPSFIDWLVFPNTYFSRTSATVVAISTDITPSQFFQSGDKIRIKQTTNKYFYITKVDDTGNQIYIEGGTDYTFAAATIDEVATSRGNAPLGFPASHAYDMNEVGFSAIADEDSSFSIDGRVVTVSYLIEGTSDTTGITIDTPTINGKETPVNEKFARVVNNNALVTAGKTSAFANISDGTPTAKGTIQGMINYNPLGFTAANTKGMKGEVTYKLND